MVTFIHDADDPILASEANTNNADLEDGQSAITAANVADNAGIRSDQLLDRFTLVPITVTIARRFDETGVAEDSVLPDEADLPGLVADSKKLVLPAGKLVYLICVQVDIIDTDPDAGVNATFWAQYNGATLGGGNPTAITIGGCYRFINDNLRPLATVAHDGILTFGIGRTAEGAGAPTWSGVTVTYWLAVENFAS